jgi:Ca2+-binding RTX toxin-like protein
VKWILDAKGAIVGGSFLTASQELQEETAVGYDINGDGMIGNSTVVSSTSYILGANQENLLLTGSGNINGTGNSLNNLITGNIGNNTIDGRDGVDTLTGLEGADSFLFSTVPIYGASTADHITDIDVAQGDLIQISRSAFGMDANTVSSLTTISASAQLASALGTSNSFIYDTSNGYLYWNQNGSVGGSGSGGIFVVLDNKSAITASTISLL